MKFKRIFLLIIEGIGVGEASDALTYSDSGVNTLKHVLDNNNLVLPNLSKLGFLSTLNMSENNNVTADYTIARPNNYGKDDLSNYYELFGIANLNEFKDFSKLQTFPVELIENLEQITNYRIIGNRILNNKNEIINELGERHLNYGSLILYSTSNSTIEISAHEDIIPISKLFEYAEKIRKFTEKDTRFTVSRVIARSFNGYKKGEFKFTDEKTFISNIPNCYTKEIIKQNKEVISIGNFQDYLSKEAVTKIIKASSSNINTINKLIDIIDKKFEGLCITSFTELKEAGSKKDINKYSYLLEELDVEIPLLLNKLDKDDLLIITSDTGIDLMKNEVGNTRENVPVIVYSRNLTESTILPILDTKSDIATTIADNFDIDNYTTFGKSFLDKLK